MAWLIASVQPLPRTYALNLGQTNLNLTFLAQPDFQTRLFSNSVTQGEWPHNTLTVPIGGGTGAAPVGYAT